MERSSDALVDDGLTNGSTTLHALSFPGCWEVSTAASSNQEIVRDVERANLVCGNYCLTSWCLELCWLVIASDTIKGIVTVIVHAAQHSTARKLSDTVLTR